MEGDSGRGLKRRGGGDSSVWCFFFFFVIAFRDGLKRRKHQALKVRSLPGTDSIKYFDARSMLSTVNAWQRGIRSRGDRAFP